MTQPEIKLWYDMLAYGQFHGYRFLRQKPLGYYIADFYCPKLRLVIEVDGDSHSIRKFYDQQRTDYFNKLDICVVRFLNTDIAYNLEGVHEKLSKIIKERVEKLDLP